MAVIIIPVNPIEVDLSEIVLPFGLTLDDFIQKTSDHCKAVLCEISILRQRYPEVANEFEFLGIELHELLNIIESKK